MPKAKRPRGTGCLYQPKNSNIWWAKYSLNGKPQRESTGTAKKREAEAFLRKRLNEVSTGNFMGASISRIRVEELALDLLRQHRNDGNKTAAKEEERWRVHLQPFFGHLRVPQVTTDLLRRYIEKRKAEEIVVVSKLNSGEVQRKGTGKFPKNATINRELAFLRAAFYLGYECTPPKVGRVPKFPMLDESDSVRKGFLRDEQFDALARECSSVGLWLRALFEMLYTYGWRRGEAVKEMKVHLVDLPNRLIVIEDSKSGEGRTVVMTQRIFNLLTACCEGKKPDDYVFTHPDGSQIGDFRKTWEKVTEAAGVPGLLVHDLRRTGVRNMRRLGIAESVCMKITGHKTAAVFKRYDITDTADLAEAAAKLDARNAQRESANTNEIEFGQSLVKEAPEVEQVDKPTSLN